MKCIVSCFLLLVYTIHLSQSTDLVNPPPMRTIYMKHVLAWLLNYIFNRMPIRGRQTVYFLGELIIYDFFAGGGVKFPPPLIGDMSILFLTPSLIDTCILVV